MLNKLCNMIQTECYKSRAPLDNRCWIFSSVDNDSFNYNSRYLFLYVRKHLPHVRPLYVICNDEKRKALAEEYGESYFVDGKTGEGLKKILGAGVWFTSAGLPAYELRPHPDRVVINLWHGIPLKKIALMEEHAGKLQKLYFQRMFSDKYTYILTTSRHLIPVMAKSFAVNQSRIKVWGQPRNDMIWEAPQKEALSEALGITLEGDEKYILYAPTYRDHGTTRLFPFPDYVKEQIEVFLAEHHWHLCIRMHLQEDARQAEYENSHIHFINEDVVDDIACWLNLFSLLITDYSSIYLDYLLLDRPMIFLPYDQEEYLKDRGLNYPYNKVTPGPKPETQEEFLEALLTLLEGEDCYKKKRMRCRDYFNEIQEPSCEHICREVVLEMKRREEIHRKKGGRHVKN